MVADFRQQKPDPHQIRITVGGSKILVDYNIGAPTADLSTAKILINSTLSTQGAWWAGFDLMNMYLDTNIKDYDNLRFHTYQTSEEFIQEYNLQQYVTPNGWVFLEIRKGMYGLPQASVLAHAKLKSVLAPHGYAPTKNTPGLWTHLTRPIAFTLVVDDFGVNAMGRVECVQRPGVFLVGVYPWGARTDFSFAWARMRAWRRPFILFRILKNTQPSGVIYCCKLYSCINSSGICDVWTRKFS